MSETKFTSGPWGLTISEPPGQWVLYSETAFRPVPAQRGHVDVGRYVGSEANAHLIAAAPCLYAALVAVVAVADRKTVEFDKARAALAKARGEPARG